MRPYCPIRRYSSPLGEHGLGMKIVDIDSREWTLIGDEQ